MLAVVYKFVVTHLVQTIVVSSIVIVGIGSVSYFASQNNTPDTKISNAKSCSSQIKIGAVAIEKDPVGDTEAWLRFDYTSSAGQDINCQYTITFYDNQNQAIRTISDIEDNFKSPSGQIYNGYSSTSYQEGMTARVVIK